MDFQPILVLLIKTLKNLEINTKNIEKAADNTHLFAADLANELVLKKGLSFREAYRKVKEGYTRAGWRGVVKFEDAPSFDPQKRVAAKKEVGMPGNLQLEIGSRWITMEQRKTAAHRSRFPIPLPGWILRMDWIM